MRDYVRNVDITGDIITYVKVKVKGESSQRPRGGIEA
jgi:hypothetical protein